jgi:hypothetical protein
MGIHCNQNWIKSRLKASSDRDSKHLYLTNVNHGKVDREWEHWRTLIKNILNIVLSQVDLNPGGGMRMEKKYVMSNSAKRILYSCN